MKKYYLINENLGHLKEGDVIYFEMPSFCSGEYDVKVLSDENGSYIDKKDAFFDGCRDFRINKPYWSSTVL